MFFQFHFFFRVQVSNLNFYPVYFNSTRVRFTFNKKFKRLTPVVWISARGTTTLIFNCIAGMNVRFYSYLDRGIFK